MIYFLVLRLVTQVGEYFYVFMEHVSVNYIIN